MLSTRCSACALNTHNFFAQILHVLCVLLCAHACMPIHVIEISCWISLGVSLVLAVADLRSCWGPGEAWVNGRAHLVT